MAVEAYRDLLDTLVQKAPLVSEALVKAEDHRRTRLTQYLGGVRLGGLEQLYQYLDAAHSAYENAPRPDPTDADD